MRKEQIRKVMVYDRAGDGKAREAFLQCMGKMQEVLAGCDTEFIRLVMEDDNPLTVTAALEAEIRSADPDLVIIPATALGEEVAPALGIRLDTGVAAHCCDIHVNEEGRMAYMVPAFGGKVIGEIFIPDTRPAIATVKPGLFSCGEGCCEGFKEIICEPPETSDDLVLLETEEYEQQKNPIDKARLIFCGGFGIGSEENWNKLEQLAEMTGGAAGCTRPVVDMGWGPDEQSMIGTSGRTVRPELYIGFGISGAAHHLCGIRDSVTIVNVNNDSAAESFPASDFTAEADAGAVIDSLLEKLG